MCGIIFQFSSLVTFYFRGHNLYGASELPSLLEVFVLLKVPKDASKYPYYFKHIMMTLNNTRVTSKALFTIQNTFHNSKHN